MTQDELRLTSLTSSAGSAAMFGPSVLPKILGPVLERFSSQYQPNLLTSPSEGVAVYHLDGETALVQSLAIITPASDDPYTYGAIAAANAMSGIYAKGGEVALALNLAGFPEDLPPEVLSEIFRGGADKVAEAGGVIAGGHTIIDAMPKYGLSVMGTAHPDRVQSAAGAQPGDLIILTKPLGTGVILTAAKNDVANREYVEAATQSMLRLNRDAAKLGREADVHAVAEVSGFGLFGAALDMADHSGVLVALRAGDLTVLPGALQYAGMSLDASAANRNLDQFADRAVIEEELPGAIIRLAFDPQTSGGLLLAIEVAKAPALVQALRDAGYPAAVVGSVHRGSDVSLDP